MITLKQKQQIRLLSTAGLNATQIAEKTGVSQTTLKTLKDSCRTIMAISDGHCGHEAGICPPKWHQYIKTDKLLRQAKETWQWYSEMCDLIKPNTVFVVGDMLDGKGEASGGSELISSDWKIQVAMATAVIERTGAKICEMCFGTPYHTGKTDDYEGFIAEKLNNKGIKTKISGHGVPIIHQIQFSIKHKVGNSTIDYGRATAVKKEKMWATLWSERDQMPKIDVLLRGHVHYHQAIKDYSAWAIIMPALQGWGSKFGVRQCSGIVDTGLIWFKICDGDTVDTLEWHGNLPKLECQKIIPYKI